MLCTIARLDPILLARLLACLLACLLAIKPHWSRAELGVGSTRQADRQAGPGRPRGYTRAPTTAPGASTSMSHRSLEGSREKLDGLGLADWLTRNIGLLPIAWHVWP
ncbi:hypothetical protein GGR56DRAFT_650400 [Xylariaceae sp. FL0804]|nr:hypothetical protein GGR56DRAFT_650400 [Xylariaceae sp. FL0804]